MWKLFLLLSTLAWADSTHFSGPVDSVNGFSVGGIACVDKTGHLVGTCASGGGTPGGTTGQLQFNNASAFGGTVTTYNATTGQERIDFPVYGADATVSSSAWGASSGLSVNGDGAAALYDAFDQIHVTFGGTLASPTVGGGLNYQETWACWGPGTVGFNNAPDMWVLNVPPLDACAVGAGLYNLVSTHATGSLAVGFGDDVLGMHDAYLLGDDLQAAHNHEALFGYHGRGRGNGTNPYAALGVSTIPEIEVKPSAVTLPALNGSGNAYACLDANGLLFRSAVTCASATTSTTTSTTTTTT